MVIHFWLRLLIPIGVLPTLVMCGRRAIYLPVTATSALETPSKVVVWRRDRPVSISVVDYTLSRLAHTCCAHTDIRVCVAGFPQCVAAACGLAD